MAWEHLSINRPHLVYIILGGFTSLFMLCSTFIKERLYIGEATVATLCGIIFGPHAANLINPLEWGNTDQITLEFSRIVLVVQCFAVGVELPRAYMERHWRSVTMLLLPVMTVGWLLTSLFIWWMFHARLSWLDSLCIAACVTATDPVLASSVVGKGKFSKRVPKHLRDLLSAESGCNDGMAFPFLYLAIYIMRYRPHTAEVALHWFCVTILYECILGAVYGVAIGYMARRAIRFAHERDMIDRESFLVFYFVLALFCAGSGSILGMDDLLIGFAAGVGFSNDGWFQEKTEESHVSDVIDLLINLTFFVYFGTIIPWEQFNSAALGIDVWRLVVVGLFVLFFRRIPVMVLLKPIVPDLKTWREALFAGHFGPIGVGAIFVSILARAELETETTTPLEDVPTGDIEHLNVITMIWPITTFLVITSIIVHGSSVAVFTLGRRINTLNLTMSYTMSMDDVTGWANRMGRPRGMSRSRSRSRGRRSMSVDSREKRPGGPVAESAIVPASRLRMGESSSVMAGPVAPDDGFLLVRTTSGLDDSVAAVYIEGDHFIFEDDDGNVLATLKLRGGSEDEQFANARADFIQHMSRNEPESDENSPVEPDKDGQLTAAVEDEQDDSELKTGDTNDMTGQSSEKLDEILASKRVDASIPDSVSFQDTAVASSIPAIPSSDQAAPVEPNLAGNSGGVNADHHNHHVWRDLRRFIGHLVHYDHHHHRNQSITSDGDLTGSPTSRPRAPAAARAYQFGGSIVVEDQYGEVLKLYDIPAIRRGVATMTGDGSLEPSAHTWPKETFAKFLEVLHVQHRAEGPTGPTAERNIRFTTPDGRRLNQAEFIDAFRQIDPKFRRELPGAISLDPSSSGCAVPTLDLGGTTMTGQSDACPPKLNLPATEDVDQAGVDGSTTSPNHDRLSPLRPINHVLASSPSVTFSRSTSSGSPRRLFARRRSSVFAFSPGLGSGPTSGSRLSTNVVGSDRLNVPTTTTPSTGRRIKYAPDPIGVSSAVSTGGVAYDRFAESAEERRRREAALRDAGEDD